MRPLSEDEQARQARQLAEARQREQEMVARLLRQNFVRKFPRLGRLMYSEPERDVCPACGEPVDADGYCPTVHAKAEEARAEFDDEAAYQIAEEWNWWHRHPNADRWTQM